MNCVHIADMFTCFCLSMLCASKGEGYWDRDVTGHSHSYLYVQHYTDYFTMALLQQKKINRGISSLFEFSLMPTFIFVGILHKMQHKHFCVCSLFPVFCSCKEHLHMVSAVWEIFTLWFIPSYWTLLPFGVSSVRQHHTGWSNDRLYFHSSSSASLFLSHCSLCS